MNSRNNPYLPRSWRWITQRKLWNGLALAMVLAVVLAAVWASSAPVTAHAQSESLPEPANVTVDTTDGSLTVTVSWDNVPGADSYRVRVRASGSGNQFGEATTVQPAQGNRSEVNVTVEDYGNWIVRVEACDTNDRCGQGRAEAFSVAPAPITAPVPGKPDGLEVSTEAGSLRVSVDWDDVTDADHYVVRWRTQGAGIEFADSDVVTATTFGCQHHGIGIRKLGRAGESLQFAERMRSSRRFKGV